MRATCHNGRVGKDGVYSAKHNDRNFDVSNAEHIDEERIDYNEYWHCYQDEYPKMTFEQSERLFYEQHFRQSLDAKNERYKKSGHKSRMKTMDEYRANKLSCPEETIIQIGKKGETISDEFFSKICGEYLEWEMETFPNVRILNASIHLDEQGAPHMHVRKVWVAESDDGLIVGQSKALEQMGIERPNPDKKKDRYNNPKVTYTEMCREHLLQICKEYGLDIETEPDKTSKRGLDLATYKRQQEEQKTQQAVNVCDDTMNEIDKALEKLDTVKEEKQKVEKYIDVLQTRQERLQRENEELTNKQEDIQQDIQNTKRLNSRLKSEHDSLKAQNDALIDQISDIIKKRDRVSQSDRLSDRMYAFMDEYKVKGQSLATLFDQREEENRRVMEQIEREFGDLEDSNGLDDWEREF